MSVAREQCTEFIFHVTYAASIVRPGYSHITVFQQGKTHISERLNKSRTLILKVLKSTL